ncbi:MAG: protein-L-isoaspartate(D-aspartate) O-methyltransferase [Bacteroidetes bacterium]|nr:protein-L-isoaspartate(D-aspartate) O-methyltransferase [Bacteroidota bacterium]
MSDTWQHKGLRKKLTEEVRRKGVASEKVLDAINKVPRHLFMDSGFVKFSYRDQAFPIGAAQTISQPFTVACQTELLEVQPHQKILEVGTGSGYQAAVLLELGARVYTIERQKELFLSVQSLLPKIGYNPRFFYGDGYQGLPTYAPFDRIIVTAGAAEIPESLINQLKIGGRMVVPVGSSNNQHMKVVIKNEDGSIETTNHGNFVFVPMIKGVSH